MGSQGTPGWREKSRECRVRSGGVEYENTPSCLWGRGAGFVQAVLEQGLCIPSLELWEGEPEPGLAPCLGHVSPPG